MKKSIKYIVTVLFLVAVSFTVYFCFSGSKNSNVNNEDLKYVVGIILSQDGDRVFLEDEGEKLYSFEKADLDEKIGTEVSVHYKSNKKTDEPASSKEEVVSVDEVVDYEVVNDSMIPLSWIDDGIFKNYYVKAYKKMKTLSVDELIGQTLLARYDKEDVSGDLNDYHLGGYVFFEVDFKDKSREEVIKMINSAQASSKIPLITAIDEEGGRVSRISSNKNLVDSPFKSSQTLYKEGGFDLIRSDTEKKSNLLKKLGLNVNFAPVVDVSTDPKDYIYDRTLGLGTEFVSQYARTVISASKGLGVSYTLKHFPGYGSNKDTHLGGSVDNKDIDRIMNEDIPPFKEGIEAGAEAVMVSHNIVSGIDKKNEASLSKEVHKLLRDELRFTGVIITDDISMGALKDADNVASRAILAGNDLLITTDYAKSFKEINDAYNAGSIKRSDLEEHAFRILAWKYYKNLLS